MSESDLSADYLVIGSGAMGMAFTDTLMTESDATVVMVDRHHQPGGHWNDAYPFVRLHQPSSFYGVNSKPLGSNTIDQVGWNKGLYELATNSEVCAYFDQVMQQQFLPSGRVRYFPLCEYLGEGRFRSHASGEVREVQARKVVDSTYMNVQVPSVRGPLYQVALEAHCAPLNDLPRLIQDFERYVVVGAGKTGMDACLFLLKNDVDPDAISWIMPRDSWMLDRAFLQPGEASGRKALALIAGQMEAIAAAESFDDLFDRVCATGQIMRLDDRVRPTMYRCATVTRAELSQLQRIQNVIRMGRVQQIDADQIVLEEGNLPTDRGTLHVDCSGDGLAQRPVVPIFDGDRITLQSIRLCQQVFSAALIAHVEIAYDDEPLKNELCSVVPHPNTDVDFLRTTISNGMNGARWAADPGLAAWLDGARLNGFRGVFDPGHSSDAEGKALQKRIEESTLPALARAQHFIKEAEARQHEA